MKRLYTLLAVLTLALLPLAVQAQNVQFHYDFGRHLYPDAQQGRPYITTTIEQQSVDKFGDTFYFVDMTFLNQGAYSANWKFMRNLRFWKSPFSVHVRYDGGLRFVREADGPLRPGTAISLNDAFFLGGNYTYLSPDKRLMFSFNALYKYIKGNSQPHNYELCPVWRYTFGNGAVTTNGFLSFWHESMSLQGKDINFRLMTQPQLWLNLNKLPGVSPELRLSVGTELRISNNVDAPQWLCIPTLAFKWSFGR